MSEQTNTPKTPDTPKTNAKAGSKPGRPAGTPAKVWDFTGLDSELLGSPQEVTAQLASMAAPMRARDERQVQVDAIVAQVHQEYVTAGRPTKWAQMPKRAYHVDPKAADTLRMMVRRAASYHGTAAKFGSDVRDKDGRAIVVFAIRDQRESKSKTGVETFTPEDLREFVTAWFSDDTEEGEEFMANFQGAEGDGEPEGPASGDEGF